MDGSVAILNVGSGDTKLLFDKSNPAEMIRASRIVKDMLRRGYALLIEFDDKGKKGYQRVLDFREDTSEYIIADFDPVVAAEEDEAENEQVGAQETNAGRTPTDKGASPKLKPGKRGRKVRAVPAGKARAVAVARSAGG